MQSTLTQKDAELCLKPQGLLATRIYASGHAYIRVGLHVRTHRVTRIFALGYTYVRIGSRVRTRKPIHIYGYPMAWLSFLHDIM